MLCAGGRGGLQARANLGTRVAGSPAAQLVALLATPLLAALLVFLAAPGSLYCPRWAIKVWACTWCVCVRVCACVCGGGTQRPDCSMHCLSLVLGCSHLGLVPPLLH